jgi:hypothetical protein
MTDAPRPVRQLHPFLVAGVVLVLGFALYFVFFWRGPLLSAGSGTFSVGNVAALAGVFTGTTGLVLKSRAPRRLPRQSVEDYWASPEVASKVSMVWFLLEGGAIVSTVGFLLSGEPAPLAVAAAGWLLLILSGPSRFAKE